MSFADGPALTERSFLPGVPAGLSEGRRSEDPVEGRSFSGNPMF
ncbi:hypothetical protein KCH_13510 [Kitasatospora cheerisanensis KCTC 2395]|uniref:Uncharacterized protein n=1 Tax=Kitasatospora cheerisanensis KCTC 2395 TaxID=1348663 RepID=A0A066Z9R4_9ACTN|nr:hypothetical protein KCH_13510 [Kitasatospora cheerisanensis KCTC 2395]